jgi:hypothetical protein
MSFVRACAAGMFCVMMVAAQAPAPAGAKPPVGRVIGEVTAIDIGARHLALKSDKGDSITVTWGEKALFLRVPPGEKDLTKASRINQAEIAVGDRVLARWQVSEDQKSATASAIIVMSKAELAKMHERKREEWQTRGATGMVTTVDAAAKRITINVRSREGTKAMTVEPGPKTEFWRYAADSVKFSDAKPGSFAEIKTGDQLRVLGDKDAEGASIKAEQVVSGTFQQMAGTVISINAAAGEVQLKDLLTKKPVMVKVNAETSVKKLPEMLAAMMARRMNAAQGGEAQGRPGAAAGGAGQGQRGPGGAGGGMRGQGGGDIQQMMERLPAIKLDELKSGDALIVSSMAGADPAKVTAITVMAGVEPLLTAAPERAINFGGWSFGEVGMPQ